MRDAGIRELLSITALAVTLAWLGGAVATESAQAVEFVEDRGTFLIMDDTEGLVESTPIMDWTRYRELVDAFERGFLEVHPDNSRLVVLLFAKPFDMGGGYHRPLANDVHGIGHAHWGASPFAAGIHGPGYAQNGGIWDGTPRSAIQGFAYLGDFRQFVAETGQIAEDELSSFVSHELGHAWLSFAWYERADGQVAKNLLDWEGTHWSVWVDSGHGASGARSLLGGHDWREVEPGIFETLAVAKQDDGFSDLDLYLLGALPAEQVDPFMVLEEASDCSWQGVPVECEDPLNANLFPPFADPALGELIYRVRATPRWVSVDDIAEVEGPRRPAHGEAPTNLPVSFVVVKRPETILTELEKTNIDTLVRRISERWNEMTRGLLPMVNRSSIDDETQGIGAFTCVEDDNTLCLSDGRFQVRVQFRSHQGEDGLAWTVDAGTDESGLFWFFGPDNWELLIKILDGCAINEKFWVYSAATTDVQYVLEVTDSADGQARRYRNEAGNRAPAVTDSSAFDCSP